MSDRSVRVDDKEFIRNDFLAHGTICFVCDFQVGLFGVDKLAVRVKQVNIAQMFGAFHASLFMESVRNNCGQKLIKLIFFVRLIQNPIVWNGLKYLHRIDLGSVIVKEFIDSIFDAEKTFADGFFSFVRFFILRFYLFIERNIKFEEFGKKRLRFFVRLFATIFFSFFKLFIVNKLNKCLFMLVKFAIEENFFLFKPRIFDFLQNLSGIVLGVRVFEEFPQSFVFEFNDFIGVGGV